MVKTILFTQNHMSRRPAGQGKSRSLPFAAEMMPHINMHEVRNGWSINMHEAKHEYTFYIQTWLHHNLYKLNTCRVKICPLTD